MKTQTIQNIFKMMIGTSALIASTAFFINTISPVQASESKLSSEDDKNKMVNVGMESIDGNGQKWDLDILLNQIQTNPHLL